MKARTLLQPRQRGAGIFADALCITAIFVALTRSHTFKSWRFSLNSTPGGWTRCWRWPTLHIDDPIFVGAHHLSRFVS